MHTPAAGEPFHVQHVLPKSAAGEPLHRLLMSHAPAARQPFQRLPAPVVPHHHPSLQAEVIGQMKAQGWKGALRPLSLGGTATSTGEKGESQQADDLKATSAGSPTADAAGAADVAARPPRRTLAEDWASLLLALRAPVVWSGAVWRMFYCTCLNGWVGECRGLQLAVGCCCSGCGRVRTRSWCVSKQAPRSAAPCRHAGASSRRLAGAGATLVNPLISLAQRALCASLVRLAQVHFLYTPHHQVPSGRVGECGSVAGSCPSARPRSPCSPVDMCSASCYRTPPVPSVRPHLTAATHSSPQLSQSASIACPQATSNTKVVLLSAVPWACAALTHLLNSMHSQHVGERRWHIAVPWMAGSICLYCLAAAADAGKVSGPRPGVLLRQQLELNTRMGLDGRARRLYCLAAAANAARWATVALPAACCCRPCRRSSNACVSSRFITAGICPAGAHPGYHG